MQKKKLTYMLSVTSDYVFAAGNIVLSLIKQRPQKDFDVTIFYEDMLAEDKKIFEETGICNLIKYKCPVDFENTIRKNCPKFNDEKFAKHFSFLKFAKFEIFNLLKKYHYAVWLDADITVQADPSEIITYAPFAITIDRGWTVQNNFTKPIANYDMDKQGVCSAVFLVSDKLSNYDQMTKWCYDKSTQVCRYFKNIDQGIFNILLQEFNIPYNLLPLDDFQCFTDRVEGAFAKIVHFGSPSKIWNNTEIISSFPEWYRIHLQWLALGGSDFSKPADFKVVNVYTKLQDKNHQINSLSKEIKSYKELLIKNKLLPTEHKKFKLLFLGIPLVSKIIKKNKIKYCFFGIPVFVIRSSGE